MKSRFIVKAIVVGMVLGVAVGGVLHSQLDAAGAKEISTYLNMITDVFLRLIKMVIAPLVLATLVTGVASMSGSGSIGRVGFKAISWFLIASLVSLGIGLVLANLFQPGTGLNLTVDPNQAVNTGLSAGSLSLPVFLSHVFPRSIIEAMGSNEVLQIVIFSLFFGSALAFVKGKGKSLIVDVLEELASVMFKVTDYVMYVAPFAVFAAIASTVTVHGLEMVMTFGKMVAQFFLGVALLWLMISLAGYLALGARMKSLLSLMREPLLIAFSTASSEAAYPKTIAALEKFGANKRVTSFVLPLGYSFNLDGSMMYQAFIVMFIAQAYNIEMTFAHQVVVLLTLLVISKGTAGVARGSLVVLAAGLPMIGLPEAGLLLILAVDPILDMGRTATNVFGCSVATAVIGRHGDADEKDVFEGRLEGSTQAV
ncbi:dicarboxylate/amino acid:cation symporter [Pseudomonas putida]|uniref:dicarboxylate/amino acid:cation symporter n=1 Tax=Pseudomonas putida TaxID=303 RepID=UPI00081901DE|nr:dicarboxylate/amino acid:cation symporter [Pseudomonas putida]OCT29983.1 C4-dicarboxylate ABC transporter [Pseudomonas putida]OCT31681.1 C4-dicarboxylate ABC transporter [Pseudomonas putida]OCT33924.1 C4-dicarboxylate ABC transporter [Pseudomonas putida]OCT40369.1 C4-dicarboxylate ABC transporter [Pseudomonas putida]